MRKKRVELREYSVLDRQMLDAKCTMDSAKGGLEEGRCNCRERFSDPIDWQLRFYMCQCSELHTDEPIFEAN